MTRSISDPTSLPNGTLSPHDAAMIGGVQEHRVHFYEQGSYPAETLSGILGSELRSGASVLVVVTEAHRVALDSELRVLGIDVGEAMRRGGFLPLDAAETLARFMVNGVPNGQLFQEFVGGQIQRLALAGLNRRARVVILGEMVALLLLDGQSEAAIQLERLWNDLAKSQRFALHCAYPIDAFCGEEHESALLRICSEHSHVAPVGRYDGTGMGREQLIEIARLQQKEQAHQALLRTKRELIQQIAEKIEVERRLVESQQALRQLSGRLLRMQDEERRHLGRELHDSVGQYLVAVKMGLDMLKGYPGAQNGMRRQILDCIGLVEKSLTDVRTMSYLLYPPLLEEAGLESAVAYYLDGFTKRSGITVTLEIPNKLGRLPREVELSIFRVLQESLTNVHRHSGSATAHVSLSVSEGNATITVKDYGKGIPPKTLETMKNSGGTFGVGVRGMIERIRQLGGELELTSTAEGTEVSATVPCAYSQDN